MKAKRICIVSSGCLSNGPRVEKEADALAEAGFDVTVVVVQVSGWMTKWDSAIAKTKPWKFRAVRAYWGLAPHVPRLLFQVLRQKAAWRNIGRYPEQAQEGVLFCRAYTSMLKEVWSIPADLYIAHNLGALPVAAKAAAQNHAEYAFDAEDDHVGELADQESAEAKIKRRLEAKLLPKARYVTAASEGIAKNLSLRYKIQPPRTVHNAFPWKLRETLDGKADDRRGKGLSLYWYSQTVGLDRGIQDAIRAMGILKGDVELHLRGNIGPDVHATLVKLAASLGVETRIHFHPLVHPSELLSRAAEHDVGLALEHPWNVNRGISISNKIFFYLLAGLTIAASRTFGQERVMKDCPNAGGLYPCGDAVALAALLQPLIDSPERLSRGKNAALEAARNVWNWERQSQSLVATVSEALGSEA